ncbi:pilus assembly FimT family protein [Hydrogenimonas sp.]
MKKAFTMLELIVVILIVAILSLIMIPRFSDGNLREAADQIISHIRYTQHLAMIDDRYDPQVSNWHQERWQISFRQCGGGNSWYYVVGRDLDHGGGIGNDEAAVNPLDKKRLFVSNACNPNSDQSDQILITEKFGIDNVQFSLPCRANGYIAFDNYGRPYKTTLGTTDYDIITGTCSITFTTNDGNFSITIEPETGYTHLTAINY